QERGQDDLPAGPGLRAARRPAEGGALLRAGDGLRVEPAGARSPRGPGAPGPPDLLTDQLYSDPGRPARDSESAQPRASVRRALLERLSLNTLRGLCVCVARAMQSINPRARWNLARTDCSVPKGSALEQAGQRLAVGDAVGPARLVVDLGARVD